MTANELRINFHQGLGQVRSDLVRLGQSVIEAIPRATSVLLQGDLEGADYVIMADAELDQRARDIEDSCIRLLALQQPMAGDLRALLAALKLVAEIERSGDLAVNICKAARRIYGHGLDPRIRGVIARMGEQAQKLFVTAIDAYAEGDHAQAAALDDMDDLLDRLQVELIGVIFDSHESGRVDLQVAVQMAMVARFYERIGDHAVNIGERVRYMVSGSTSTSGTAVTAAANAAADPSAAP